MAGKKACAGIIEIGATPSVLGELRSYDITESSDEIDITVMGTCVKSTMPGPVDNRLEAETFFEAQDAGQLLIVVGQETVTQITLFPQGKGSGLPQAQGNFRFLSKTTRGEVTGALEMMFTAASDENGVAWTTQV